MKHFIAIFFCLTIFTGCTQTQDEQTESFVRHWQSLFEGEKLDQTESFCTRWLSVDNLKLQAQAHICLATVSYGKEKKLVYPTMLKHVNAAIKLTPQDLPLHFARINLAVKQDNADDINRFLEDSMATYNEKGANIWLPFAADLFYQGQHKGAMKFLHVLNRHFPKDASVLGNLAAIYMSVQKVDLAETFVNQALALNADDALNNWNLARIFDVSGRHNQADGQYQKAIGLLEAQGQAQDVAYCMYADFLEKRLGQKQRSCEYSAVNCPMLYKERCE